MSSSANSSSNPGEGDMSPSVKRVTLRDSAPSDSQGCDPPAKGSFLIRQLSFQRQILQERLEALKRERETAVRSVEKLLVEEQGVQAFLRQTEDRLAAQVAAAPSQEGDVAPSPSPDTMSSTSREPPRRSARLRKLLPLPPNEGSPILLDSSREPSEDRKETPKVHSPAASEDPILPSPLPPPPVSLTSRLRHLETAGGGFQQEVDDFARCCTEATQHIKKVCIRGRALLAKVTEWEKEIDEVEEICKDLIHPPLSFRMYTPPPSQASSYASNHRAENDDLKSTATSRHHWYPHGVPSPPASPIPAEFLPLRNVSPIRSLASAVPSVSYYIRGQSGRKRGGKRRPASLSQSPPPRLSPRFKNLDTEGFPVENSSRGSVPVRAPVLSNSPASKAEGEGEGHGMRGASSGGRVDPMDSD